MGVIVNTVNSLPQMPSAIGQGSSPIIKQQSQMSLKDSLANSFTSNMNTASSICPIVNESKSMVEGISLGDSQIASVNFALLSMYAMVGGAGKNIQGKLLQSGMDASKLMIICPTSVLTKQTLDFSSSGNFTSHSDPYGGAQGGAQGGAPQGQDPYYGQQQQQQQQQQQAAPAYGGQQAAYGGQQAAYGGQQAAYGGQQQAAYGAQQGYADPYGGAGAYQQQQAYQGGGYQQPPYNPQQGYGGGYGGGNPYQQQQNQYGGQQGQLPFAGPKQQPYYGNAPAPTPYGVARQKSPSEDIKQRKIFAGGIGGANEETFYNYFVKFGEIEDYFVQRDPVTGVPRGFGFVVFKEQGNANAVIQQNGQHNIDGYNVNCKIFV